jgi:hypothetical protein
LVKTYNSFENEHIEKAIGKPYSQQIGRKPGKGAGKIVNVEEEITIHDKRINKSQLYSLLKTAIQHYNYFLDSPESTSEDSVASNKTEERLTEYIEHHLGTNNPNVKNVADIVYGLIKDTIDGNLGGPAGYTKE